MKKIILSLLCVLSMQMMAQTNMELAKKALDNDDFSLVIEYTTKQIAEQPKDVEAYAYRAIAYGTIEEYGKALKDADMAIACWNKKCKDLTFADLYALRATVYEQIDELEKALADYNMAIKKDSKNVKSYINRAEFYYNTQLYEKAEADYRAALRMDEENSTIKIEIARCLLAQPKLDEAYSILNTLTKLEPRNEEACRLLALVYLYKEDIKEFIDQYILYLELASDGDLSPLSHGAAVEYSYTIRAITRALNNSDNKAYWLGVRARVERENAHYEEAVEDLKRMEIIYGDTIENPFVYYQMALSYDGLYDYPKSIKYYNLLLNYEERIGSPNPFDYVNRADAYLNNNEVDKALADCDKALSLATEGVSHIYYVRGWINDMARNYEAAFDDYNKAIKADDGLSSTVYVMRGKKYLLYKNDSVRAKADFEMALQLDTTIEGGSNRHYALMYLGRITEAKAWIAKILDAEPEDVGQYYDAACLYARMGEKEKAVDFLRQAFDLGYRNLNHIAQDDDLDSLRDCKDFNELVNKYKQEKIGDLFNKL
ncbi:MAG: tetratricopeptide repeat protein [Paludibacteraceae bacterium]|nr:tetratricopeptide repeat protein [Paludibacteraceae bacterium]